MSEICAEQMNNAKEFQSYSVGSDSKVNKLKNKEIIVLYVVIDKFILKHLFRYQLFSKHYAIKTRYINLNKI